MKRIAGLIVLGIAALLVIGIGSGIWLVRFRPMAVFAWTTRSALSRAGLRKVLVGSPAGPQLVWTGGSGPVVVLLHGAGDQSGTWFKVVPELIGSHTLIVPDLAGHGESAPASGPIQIKSVYDGVVADIETLAPGKPVTIVGNSLGGWVAMLVAQRRPELVAKVICVDGGAIKGSSENAVVLPRNRAEARASVAQTRDARSKPIPDYVLDDLVRQAASGPLGRFAATSGSMSSSVLDDAALAQIKTPVRLIWGASDRLLPLDYARRMSASLRDVQLQVIDRCGHVPQVECPDRFIAALRNAL